MNPGQLEGQMNLQVGYDLAGSRPSQVVDGLKVLAHGNLPTELYSDSRTARQVTASSPQCPSIETGR